MVINGGPHDRPDQGLGVVAADPPRGPSTSPRHAHRVPPATDARAVIAELLRLDSVHTAQVVQILRPRLLVAALVGGQQRLTELGLWLAIDFVQRSDLGHHVRQRDAERESLRFHPAGAEDRPAVMVNVVGDLYRRPPPRQTLRAYFASNIGFLAGGFRHLVPASSPLRRRPPR